MAIPNEVRQESRAAGLTTVQTALKTTAVVLNWNGYQMTAVCIRSLLEMDTPNNLEIVVIDNGSTDGSAEILRQEFPNITILRQNNNLGFAAGCNVGIRHALAREADYVLLVNNDTYVASDFLNEILAAMQSDSRIAAVCPKIYFADKPNLLWYAGADFSLWTGRFKVRGWKQVDSGQCDQYQDTTQATGCAMLVRPSALSDVGLLDERFWAYAEDLDWSLRFLKHGYRLAFAPKARLWHCDGATAVKSLASGSQALRQFLSSRNMVFLARKHVRWWQMPSHVLGFLIYHVAAYTVLRLRYRDFRALFAIYRGIGHGLWQSVNSR
jgi:GT2 family glycosyltransferase